MTPTPQEAEREELAKFAFEAFANAAWPHRVEPANFDKVLPGLAFPWMKLADAILAAGYHKEPAENAQIKGRIAEMEAALDVVKPILWLDLPGMLYAYNRTNPAWVSKWMDRIGEARRVVRAALGAPAQSEGGEG